MARSIINLGVAPTGQGGDTFRTASQKNNDNAAELYSALGAPTGAITPAGARTALGVPLTATADDQTAGRVLKVGDAGINTPLKARVSTNPTDILLSGRGWDFSTLAANTPPGSQDGALLSMSYGLPDIYAVQLFADWRQNSLKIRSVVNSGSPTAWATVYTTQNTTRAADGTLKAV
ncbi:hypothetical protein BFW91_01910 [Pseudomonas fluorescens]|jgi:hypothetical protein|uniref:hypothetical protein n=1 Tax=Pseudomonas fluorescens TaxID=294 RepID=UPI00099B7FF1|nr:hypothetical protein [Pseudomonas fluorescens]NNB67687.1 hypothetical protein [Pseudomonas fluorescens]OPB16863.1 hypothetical protein BFW91_01910 [Pseudomonas fluorescens]